MADYLPPVITELKGDIDDLAAKVEEAKALIDSLDRRPIDIKTKIDRDGFSRVAKDVGAARREVEGLARDADRAGIDVGRMFRNFDQGFSKRPGVNHRGFFGNLLDGLKRVTGGFKNMWNEANSAERVLMSLATPAGGIAVLIGLIGGLSGVLSALGGGLTAATLGLGALAAVAGPAIKDVASGMSAISQATDNYSTASKNLNISLKTSKQDLKAYDGVIKNLSPNLRNAAGLLRNSHLQWQNLTQAQKRNLIALSNNSDALKNMLPDQKNALAALMQQRQAWDQLSPAEKTAVKALQGLGSAWSQITKQMQPSIDRLITQFAKLVRDILPFVVPLAKQAARAIGGLMKELDKGVKSSGFKTWMREMTSMAGPAITTLGHAIGNISIALGKFFTVLGRKDTMMIFNGTIRILVDSITGLLKIMGLAAKAVQIFARFVGMAARNIRSAWDQVMQVWHTFLHDTASVFDQVRHTIATWVDYVGTIPGKIVSFFAGLPGKLFSIGKSMISQFASGIASEGGAVAGAIGGILSHIPGAGMLGNIFHSITGLASGTMSAPAGWHWVGENGPELMRFAGGEQVMPHAASMAVAGGAAGGVTVHERQPIVIKVGQRKLLETVKESTYSYNVANNNRTPRGSPVGTLTPR